MYKTAKQTASNHAAGDEEKPAENPGNGRHPEREPVQRRMTVVVVAFARRERVML